MGTLCFYGEDNSLCLQKHVNYLHHPGFCLPKTKNRLVKKNISFPQKRILNDLWMTHFSCPFFVNKLGFQPTVIAQARWSHRLSAFTQAVICIRLFAFVCSLWHFLLSHKAAVIMWEWKGPPGMPGRGCLDRSDQHVFITGTYWFTHAHGGGNNPNWD